MKKIVSILISLCVILSFLSITAIADGAKKSGLFTYELKGNGNAVITGFDWNANGHNDVYVPRQIDGYNVTEIGKYSFSSEQDTMDFDNTIGEKVVVVLPDSITLIGEKAFYCTNITAITIPSSVQLIGSGAFAGCRNIKQQSVDANNSVYTTIDGVLYNKTNKELVSFPLGFGDMTQNVFEIPNGIVSIGDYAFAGLDCGNGRDGGVIFPESVKKIGNYSFYRYTHSNWQTINDLNETREIGDYAFAEADISNLNAKNVTTVGERAFSNAFILNDNSNRAKKVTGVTIQNGWPMPNLESIGDYAFANAYFSSDDNYVSFGAVKSIGEGAFYNFRAEGEKSGQCNLSLSTSLRSIPQYAFYGCKFKKIAIPEGVETIGDYAFANINLNIDKNNSYKWKETVITCPTTLKVIGNHTFEQSGLNLGFNEPSSLKEIGDFAFYGAGLFIAPPIKT